MIATIPWFKPDPIHLGPLTLQPFGLLVATGVFIGAAIARRAIKRRGLDEEHYQRMITWMLLWAFGLAHIVAVTAYHPGRLIHDPIRLLKFWDGLSSVGGFVGAIIGSVWYARRHGLRYIPYADGIMEGFVFGWFFGRSGCSVVHDHPGIRSDFFLAVDYPANYVAGDLTGGPRLDLGLLELLFTVFLILLFWWLKRKPRFPGLYLGLAGVLYAPVRFALDFLRVPDAKGGDTRYLGITPAQWAVVVLFVLAAWVLYANKDKPPLLPDPNADEANGAKSGKGPKPQLARKSKKNR